ncbi:hemolysin family protein [Aquibium sp. ELW1220]|uniref:hemolysin family protein n=1 Tax=Aquibium sp. ELW1220 TaxID=2976766 RepID=UPI0025B10371|nr:hemolysin family protein [Aquibium sp. ELW1220]MDN2578629.1 hemolysin family protein [Aquibium sp. ELW1220]
MNETSTAVPTPPPAADAGGPVEKSAPADEGQSSPAPSVETAKPAPRSQAPRPSLISRVQGLFRFRNGSTLREDLADALAGGEDHGATFSPGERAMLNNILRLREVRVEDVMIPRADIEAIDISTKLGDLLTLFEESGHSRMPVYAESLDDPRGMVHIRDIVAHITRTARSRKRRSVRKTAAGEVSAPTPAPKPAGLDLANVDLDRSVEDLNLMRPVLFVPPSMLASDLMSRMQAGRIQMALVIDEYGGTDGLVSLEDIVEMVVGDIEDEHDEEEPLITKVGDGIFIVDAKAEIEEVAKVIGGEFSAGEHGEYVDTIGGIIFNALGRVPARGEVVQAIPGFEFHVLDADPRRVKRVRIVQGRAPARRGRASKEKAA